MKKNNLAGLITISLFALITLNACAQQDHRQNEQILMVANVVTNNTSLLNNREHTIPLLNLEKKNIASVDLGFNNQRVFDSILYKYTKITSFSAANYTATATLNDLEDDLKYFNTVLITMPSSAANDTRNVNFILNLAKRKQVIVSIFGAGGVLKLFDGLDAPILWTTENTPISAAILPQMIFGGIAVTHQLSSSFSTKYASGTGYTTSVTRLKYTVPEDAKVNAENLKEIDNIANEAIQSRATPGLVVLVAKDGKVIFNKAYGHHTYEKDKPDQLSDIFDVASLTKTTATTPTIMRLVEQQKLNLDTNVGAYIPKARTSPMNSIKVREVMLHQAGFIPFIPFHNNIQPGDYSKDSTALFNTKVADGYYVRKNYVKDIMWPRMLNSPIKTRGSYVYSDISMYVMKEIAEQISGSPLDQYVQDNFYKPLGMQTTSFLPRNKFQKEQIVPTEQDTYFRKTLLQGYVHDQGAALAGGVSGHAGLFASANDLAIIYQMLLNKGSYGGHRYFNPQTVTLFTSKQSDVSRRGLGFDRWDPDLTKKYPSEKASPQTYGHTGYTGTCVWVDEARGLIYIFLSNRVYPSVTDKLSTMKIRGRIQDAINNAIDKAM